MRLVGERLGRGLPLVVRGPRGMVLELGEAAETALRQHLSIVCFGVKVGPVEPSGASFPDQRRSAVDEELRVASPAGVFGGERYLHDALLSRARTAEVHLDLFAGPQPPEPDEAAREVHGLHRFTHAQTEDLALSPTLAVFQTRWHAIGDGHETPGHLRVSDGHRASLFDLLPEDGREGYYRVKDIAEADGHTLGATALVKCRDGHLGDSLAGVDHARGPQGFVRRD